MEKPSLEDFIAALPECPDCGEKLHRFAYCPGRSRIRPEAMPDPTPTEKGHTMSNAVITRQGAPSKPGEKVDTSAAPVVKEEKAAVAMASDEGKAVERKADIAAKAGAMVPAAKGKGNTKAPKAKGSKAKAPAKPRSTGNGSGPSTRITAEWSSAKKRDVLVKDEVTTADGVKLTVIGRWTRRAKDGSLTPFVTGRIVSGAPDGKSKGDRHNAAAKDCTHVK